MLPLTLATQAVRYWIRRGRLIGINTAIYSPSGASAGIGFAVPVDTVMRVAPQLIKSGKYIRPALGIEANEQINERLKHPGSATEKAGLKDVTVTNQAMTLGDILVAVNGKDVYSYKNCGPVLMTTKSVMWSS